MQNKDVMVRFEHIGKYVDGQAFQSALSYLPSARAQKVMKIKNEEAKRLSLTAGILLMDSLSEFGVLNKDLQFRYGMQGKPYLKDYPETFFSLSHSGEMAMCVVAEQEVGCDIEKVKQRDNRKLAKRFFTENEYQYIFSKETTEKQNDAFYRIWTLKESFLKTTGEGISIPLDSFEFTFDAEDMIQFSWTGHEEQFEFIEQHVEGYKAAVCIRKE